MNNLKDKPRSILIFEYHMSGHRLEYMHHIFCSFVNNENTKYIFVTPLKFKEVRDELTWPKAENISIHYLTEKEYMGVNTPGIRGSFFKARILNDYIKRFEVDGVFLNTLMGYLPFLPFLVDKRISVFGIIYNIYIYADNQNRLGFKVLNKLKYLLITRFILIKRVWLVNARLAPKKLNELYQVDKFHFLPDPYFPIAKKETLLKVDSRENETKGLTLLHFGGLTERKGSLEILRAIEIMSDEELCGDVFIFAGKVYSDIRDSFYELYEEQKKRVKIELYDEFCSYEFLGELCQRADCILLPYKVTTQSSGLLGYAAQFGVPVLAPSTGLIGEVVQIFDLGFTLDRSDAIGLKESILTNRANIKAYDRHARDSYLKENSVEAFTKVLSSHLQ